ncbi:MAG: hypothetical protein Aurels2KO_53840 [Aureliella sp.]
MPEIKQYVTETGVSPFALWTETLSDEALIRVQTAIARIEQGNKGDVKPVGEGVSERRITFGPGYRVYFGQDGADLVLLLIGGTKTRQQQDISKAQEYWADYKRRKAIEARKKAPPDTAKPDKKRKKNEGKNRKKGM